jgi:hypothetical protein
VLNDTPVSIVPYIVTLPLGDADDEGPSTFAHAAQLNAAMMQTSHGVTMRIMMSHCGMKARKRF